MLVFRGVKPHREVLGGMLHDLSTKNGGVVLVKGSCQAKMNAKLPQAIKKDGGRRVGAIFRNATDITQVYSSGYNPEGGF